MHGRSFADLDEQLFMGDDARCRFVADRIRGSDPSTDPLEQLTDRAGLGTTMVWHNEDGDRVDAVITFIPAAELERRRLDAYRWIHGLCRAGIDSTVVVYTLTEDESDFETLEELLPPWFPETINYGDRILYEGPAYPLPGARGITVSARGEFVIGDAVADLWDSWYCIHDRAGDEELWLTEPLLLSARFLDDERRRNAARTDLEPETATLASSPRPS